MQDTIFFFTFLYKKKHNHAIKRPFGIAFVTAFHQILNFFFFAKIECGLYFLDRFDVLMSKIIFKK
jgi:uncharacterized membrane protein (DUF106 family)